MTASKRINLHTDLNRIDETRGSITVEGGELPCNERDFDRQTHTQHRASPHLCYARRQRFRLILHVMGNFRKRKKLFGIAAL